MQIKAKKAASTQGERHLPPRDHLPWDNIAASHLTQAINYHSPPAPARLVCGSEGGGKELQSGQKSSREKSVEAFLFTFLK